MTDTIAPFTFADARAAVLDGASPSDAAARVVASMTGDEKLWCLDGDAPTWAGLHFLAAESGYHKVPFYAARVERVGLPGIAFSDGPRGVVIGNATCFPVSMARAATWDPELEERIGDVIGRELRASGATLYGGVCVNILRHPAWGRAQETYGEDPFHLGEMGAALTRGVQRHALATVKHFACNSMENARFKVDVQVDEVALHEVYLPHFERIVDEGVACVMTAYNSVNGEWCGQSHQLVKGVLRGEWGFEGFVITDWILGLREAATSLAAGTDIEMPYRMVRAEHLPAALDAGDASWDDVDAAVTHIVSTLLRFDGVLSAAPPDRSVIRAPEHRALAREAAERSIVLLQNDPVAGTPVLPLDASSVGRVAVIGALADTVNLGDGGSSDVWALDCVAPLAGLRDRFGDAVAFDAGESVDAGADLAHGADVAIVIAGYTYEHEGEFIGDTGPELAHLFPPQDDPELVERFQAEVADPPPAVMPDHVAARPGGRGFAKGGDRSSLRLLDHDVELIRAVAAANPRTVVVIQAGSAVVCSEWAGDVAAIVQAWYGGEEAGTALARVLAGDVNPSGRLPFSVPADESHLPPFDRDAERFTYDLWHGWWHLEREGHAPAFPFGFGLSYTTFEVRDVAVALDGGVIRVRGTIANAGARDGADVVQVYATLPDESRPRRLVGFQRVEVGAGTSAPFAIDVPAERLRTRDAERHAWVGPSGRHTIEVARHHGDPESTTVAVDLS